MMVTTNKSGFVTMDDSTLFIKYFQSKENENDDNDAGKIVQRPIIAICIFIVLFILFVVFVETEDMCNSSRMILREDRTCEYCPFYSRANLYNSKCIKPDCKPN